MAGYGSQKILGRVVVLIVLIIVLAIGGLIWFDFLNIIDAKAVLSPLYSLIGLAPRTQQTLTSQDNLSIDAERLAVRLEELQLRSLELDKQEDALKKKQAEIEQMAQELEDRQKALDEREKTFNLRVQQFENRRVNVEQNARYLVGMPPDKAVKILAAMDDQDIIDVFRMTEEIALREGKASLVAYWLSLLPPERSAELQRKMAGKPRTLH
ncbi:MAG: flagellar protein FlbB [Termitinemataceae bacterium]